jgi:hypothetical protein
MGGIYEMIYVLSFIEFGSAIQKLTGGNTDAQTHINTDSIEIAGAYFYFFKIRKVD